ncbi:hypothetical protein F5Y13DRAFT_191480 [Hypoxylon sp. FL1857]|nr:hypothetical protein F5Y13DRAFT_191480 [Hypoxylon sp. FL1857]
MSISVNNDFEKSLIVGLAVGSVVTVVVLTLVCVLAQCGPRMCGRIDRKERWFEPTLEEGYAQEAPLVPTNSDSEKIRDRNMTNLPLSKYRVTACTRRRTTSSATYAVSARADLAITAATWDPNPSATIQRAKESLQASAGRLSWTRSLGD